MSAIIKLLNKTDIRFKERKVYEKANECKQIIDDLVDKMVKAKE